MAFEKDIYNALEDIVGERNISEDVSFCENYRCNAAQTSAHYGPEDHTTPLPQAVILPGSTKEVKQIIEVCNKYGIQFKASTTFWSSMGYIGSDYAIQMDMRRMRSIEIDPLNQIAVIEPYAIAAVVQAEAMKHGLNLNIPGVGCSSSPLASTAGWVGFGPSSLFMGGSSENLLGAEWVLPNGEVLKTGSVGAGSGWFCGEGPGPGTRAILRGMQGTMGAMGVCTKVAIRLHPWPGPKELPSVGTIPAYKATLPDNFRCYTLCFPDWASWAKAISIFHENDVLYLGHRQFNSFGRNLKASMIRILSNPDMQLCDIPDLLMDEELMEENKNMKLDIQIVIAGMTPRDTQYKENAVNEILRQTGGWKSKMMLDKELEDWALLYMIRLGRKNLNFVMCGAYEGNFGMSSNVFVTTPLMEEAAEVKRKWENEHTSIAATGGDSEMGSISLIGGGGLMGWEFFINFDAHEKESIHGTRAFVDETNKWMLEKGLGPDMCRWNSDLRRPDGYDFTQEQQNAILKNYPQPSIFEYQWKVREAVNPKHLGGSYYRTLTPDHVPIQEKGK